MLLVLLVLLLGGVVVADRVGVRIAEDKVAQRIVERAGLAGPPAVDITGFPFLTQAVSGRYTDVRVSLTADQLGQPAGTQAQVSLRGVRLPLSDVLSGSVQEVPVDRVDGTATLSYDLLAEQLGGDTTLAPAGGGLRITRTVSVLGFDVPVTAAGTVSLDGQDVVIDVQQASAADLDVPGFVLDRAADLLDFRYPVPALPFGLQLTSVDPGRDGVQVRAHAAGTVLRG
ncbi:Protein of unknown function [Modestobacter sp. DSM 44400]|nr:Protein of unknown function [Modestobacter sp. DSM 44400]